MDSLLKILIDDFGQPAIYLLIVSTTIWFTLECSKRFHNSRKKFATKEDLALLQKRMDSLENPHKELEAICEAIKEKVIS